MKIDDIIDHLESLKENSRSFLDKDEPDSVWQDDIDALDAAIGIIRRLRWIPVEERLPERGEGIVLIEASGNPPDGPECDHAWLLAEYYARDGWYIYEFPDWENPDVTAWMPLPEPCWEERQDENK